VSSFLTFVSSLHVLRVDYTVKCYVSVHTTHHVLCAVQERLIDTVVEGFIHLQQFHMNEIVRGLARTVMYTGSRKDIPGVTLSR